MAVSYTCASESKSGKKLTELKNQLIPVRFNLQFPLENVCMKHGGLNMGFWIHLDLILNDITAMPAFIQ